MPRTNSFGSQNNMCYILLGIVILFILCNKPKNNFGNKKRGFLKGTVVNDPQKCQSRDVTITQGAYNPDTRSYPMIQTCT